MSTTTRSGLVESEGAQIHRIGQFDAPSRVRSSCSPMRALITTGRLPWALLPGARPAPLAAAVLAGATGRLAAGGAPGADCSSPGDGIVSSAGRLRLGRQPAGKHDQNASAMNTDFETILRSLRDHKAKLAPETLYAPLGLDLQGSRPSSPCRDGDRPLQAILMLLRPGSCRKVRWSGCPAVSPRNIS